VKREALINQNIPFKQIESRGLDNSISTRTVTENNTKLVGVWQNNTMNWTLCEQ